MNRNDPDECYEDLRQRQIDRAVSLITQEGMLFICSDGKGFCDKGEAISHQYKIERNNHE